MKLRKTWKVFLNLSGFSFADRHPKLHRKIIANGEAVPRPFNAEVFARNGKAAGEFSPRYCFGESKGEADFLLHPVHIEQPGKLVAAAAFAHFGRAQVYGWVVVGTKPAVGAGVFVFGVVAGADAGGIDRYIEHGSFWFCRVEINRTLQAAKGTLCTGT